MNLGLSKKGNVMAACLLLLGCDDTARPSTETQYLEKTVVPKIEDWAEGSSEIFPLSFAAIERHYDKLCLLPQYWSLESIEKLTDEPIQRHHSSFGNSVPENYGALVAVKDGNVHAALIHLRKIGLGARRDKCLSANQAQLRRVRNPLNYTDTAILE